MGVAVSIRAGFCTLVFACICQLGAAASVMGGVAGILWSAIKSLRANGFWI